MRKIKVVLFLIAITSIYFLIPINVVFAINKHLSLGSVMSAQELSDGSLLIADGGGRDKSFNGAKIIIIDKDNNVLWKYNSDLVFPHSARLFSDNSIVIADSDNNRVFAVDKDTKKIIWSSEQWKGGMGQLSDGSKLNYPNNAEEVSPNKILITDRNNNRIMIVDTNGNIIVNYAGVNQPHNAHYLGGKKIIVSSAPQNKVVIYNPENDYFKEYASMGLNQPHDGDFLANGNILITDSNNNRVIEVDKNDRIFWEYKKELYGAQSAIRLKNGNTLIVDSFNYRLLEITPNHEVIREIGDDFIPIVSDTLKNGDFEEMNVWPEESKINRYFNGERLSNDLLLNNYIFSSWFPGTLFSEGQGKISVDTKIKVTGKQSARIDFDGNGSLFLTQFIKVEGGKTYIFSGWIKTDLVTPHPKGGISGARFEFYWMNKYGRDIDAKTIFSKETFGKTDWKMAEFSLVAPSEAVAVRLHTAVLNNKGITWFDNIQFDEKTIPYSIKWDYVFLSLVGTIIVISLFKILFRRFN